MNEKIEELVAQLLAECHKENITLLCTMQKRGEGKVFVWGDTPSIGLCMAIQEEILDRQLPVPAEVLRTIAEDSLEEAREKGYRAYSHTIVVEDVNDFPTILDKILRGEFE